MNFFVLKSWMQAKFATGYEQGANLVEYILLVALIALAVIAAVVFLRGQVSSKFDQTRQRGEQPLIRTRRRPELVDVDVVVHGWCG